MERPTLSDMIACGGGGGGDGDDDGDGVVVEMGWDRIERARWSMWRNWKAVYDVYTG